MMHWNIVAIDDDPGARDIIQKRLSLENEIRVWTAENTKEGLTLIEKEKPNAIILDHLPPDNAGIAFCKTLKNNSSLKDIPVIFFTSHREFGFEASAELAGAMRVIPKLDMVELIAVIQHLKDPNASSAAAPAEE